MIFLFYFKKLSTSCRGYSHVQSILAVKIFILRQMFLNSNSTVSLVLTTYMICALQVIKLASIVIDHLLATEVFFFFCRYLLVFVFFFFFFFFLQGNNLELNQIKGHTTSFVPIQVVIKFFFFFFFWRITSCNKVSIDCDWSLISYWGFFFLSVFTCICFLSFWKGNDLELNQIKSQTK